MISKDDIEHLKDLARVEFGKEETEKLARDLGDILGYVAQLKEIDVSDVPEMTHAAEGVKNVFRADTPDATLERGITHPPTPSLTLREGERGRDSSAFELARELIDAFPDKHNADHGAYLKVKSIL